MGDYVNPGSDHFQISKNSDIYVDKSNLIIKTNALFRKKQRFICISRPRRFGKTTAAEMLAAYYGRGSDAHFLFEDLAIAKDPSYEMHLNKYNVIMVNMQEFLSKAKAHKKKNIDETLHVVTLMIIDLQSNITRELIKEYPEIPYADTDDFTQVLKDTYNETELPFAILIDEWDCLFREYKNDKNAQEEYLDFLRLWLKDQKYVGLAYMTGILPIKKYGTHSALNMFREFSMTHPRKFLNYFGFRDYEVAALCTEYDMNMKDIEDWYNGYFVDLGTPIYNPTSVVECLSNEEIANYWNSTETYEALKDYIVLNFDNLQTIITQLIAGASIEINPNKFANDMHTFNSVDDVLTLLVHLGYLTYNYKNSTVRIPNAEVKQEFINSIEDLDDWRSVVDAIRASKSLLQDIWDMDEAAVAEGIAKVHEDNTSILQYNNENSLSCVLSLALYIASNYYTIIRELPSGKGYADLVFIPKKKYVDKPAMVVELKWDKEAKGALAQISERNYSSALADYHGNLLLVGINYKKDTKIHECSIEMRQI